MKRFAAIVSAFFFWSPPVRPGGSQSLHGKGGKAALGDAARDDHRGNGSSLPMHNGADPADAESESPAITRSLQGSRSLSGFLFVMLVSLAYGMFHAAGPGHGKTIVSSFFLANNAKLRHSFVVGYLIAIVHALAALAVVLILYYIIRGLFSTGIEQANHWIQLVTFGVIAVLGAFILVGRIAGQRPSPPLRPPSP